jgi:hypothetical protein
MKNTVYHGTNEVFNSFDLSKLGLNYEDGASKRGFFFSEDADDASFFGNRVIQCDIILNNPMIITDDDISAFEQSWLEGLQETDPKVYEFQIDTQAYCNSREIRKGLELAIEDASACPSCDGVIIETTGEPRWFVVFYIENITIINN